MSNFSWHKNTLTTFIIINYYSTELFKDYSRFLPDNEMMNEFLAKSAFLKSSSDGVDVWPFHFYWVDNDNDVDDDDNDDNDDDDDDDDDVDDNDVDDDINIDDDDDDDDDAKSVEHIFCRDAGWSMSSTAKVWVTSAATDMNTNVSFSS